MLWERDAPGGVRESAAPCRGEAPHHHRSHDRLAATNRCWPTGGHSPARHPRHAPHTRRKRAARGVDHPAAASPTADVSGSPLCMPHARPARRARSGQLTSLLLWSIESRMPIAEKRAREPSAVVSLPSAALALSARSPRLRRPRRSAFTSCPSPRGRGGCCRGTRSPARRVVRPRRRVARGFTGCQDLPLIDARVEEAPRGRRRGAGRVLRQRADQVLEVVGVAALSEQGDPSDAALLAAPQERVDRVRVA
jgi:hypothetical protein